MIEKNCEEIQELLVDYSDNLLSQQETNLVSQHLSECENCQKLLKALNHSLELSNVIWEDNFADIGRVSIERKEGCDVSHQMKDNAKLKVRFYRTLRIASIAASVFIVITTAIFWNSFHKPDESESQLSLKDIEKNINDSASAAQLLAATSLLENYPDYKEIAENQYHYIATMYPDTPAAKQIKLKNQ